MWYLLWLSMAWLPRWLRSKESACNAQNAKFDPWVRRSPGEGNGDPLQYSCLGYPTDRGGWRATVHGVRNELDTTERLNNSSRWQRSLARCCFPVRGKGCLLFWRLRFLFDSCHQTKKQRVSLCWWQLWPQSWVHSSNMLTLCFYLNVPLY